jgi:hypothetical protein
MTGITHNTGAESCLFTEGKKLVDAVEPLAMLSLSLYTVQSSSSRSSLPREGLLPLAGVSCTGTMVEEGSVVMIQEH